MTIFPSPHKKYLFALLLLIIISISSVVIWWFLNLNHQTNNEQLGQTTTPSDQNETQGQNKTYRNTEFGFEFQYPQDWEVKENTFGSYYSKFNLVVNPKAVRSSNFTVSINIVLPEFPERSFQNVEKTATEVTVDGVSGVKYQYEFESSQETAIVLPLGEYKVILGTDNEQYVDTFNQVLSTFKFLE